MIQIPFRKYDFKITLQNGTNYIFDEVRKKNVVLGPEEWVRQNMLHYLLYDIAYPKNRVAVEKEFNYNGRKKRFDILVFDAEMKPFLLVECKASNVNISNATLQQIIDYNLHYNSKYLLISNGNSSWCFTGKEGTMIELAQIPAFQENA